MKQKHLEALARTGHVNTAHAQSLSSLERFALYVVERIGTMQFFFLLCGWQGSWMIWQTFLDPHPFDPYPFPFLLFCSNIIQLVFLPLLMVGTNLQGRHAEMRAEFDHQTLARLEGKLDRIEKGINPKSQANRVASKPTNSLTLIPQPPVSRSRKRPDPKGDGG